MDMSVATPTTPQEFEEVLQDKTKVENLFKDGQFGEFVKNYVGAVQARDADLDERVKEQTQIVLAELLQDKKKAKALNLNPIDNGPNTNYSKIQNDRAIGAPLNGKFKDIGEVALAALGKFKGENAQELRDKAATVQNYMSEKVPSSGGFLVPEEYRAELLRLSLESAVVRPRARIVPMSSSTLAFPVIDSTSNVNNVYGGIAVFRTEEGADLTESAPTFGKIKLEVTKQTAYALVTNELVNDAAGGFLGYIREFFPEAVAFAEDDDYLNGTGVGEPLGALSSNNPALVSVSKETSQVAATIVYENIVKMYARMLPTSLNRAVWVVGPDVFPQLATMGLIVGTGGSVAWLPNLVGGPTMTLLGRPVIVSEKVPGAVGTKGDISFVDFGYYLIGDRQQMEFATSEHVAFNSDKTAFRVIQRNDGRPWLQSAVTPKNNTATLSPFVQLNTRS
jgi:HK97 family phage major capsid protein